MSDNNFSLSRVEQILKAALTDTEYGKVPQSRVEYLLLELIKKGGGGSAGGYVPSGNAYFDDLPTPSKDYLGYVYNMVEDFTTTADFLEGAGKTYPAGSNVAVVDAGSADNPKYMFDVLAGFIDLSDYVTQEALSAALRDYVDSDALATLLTDYVLKEQGKGLSTNDYTDKDKQKLGELVNYDDTDIKHDISEIESVIPSTATPQNPLATASDVSDTAIPSTSTTSPVTDSADGMVQGLTIYGRSKKSKNLFSSGFEQGVIYASGVMETVPTRIRTSDYIPISENTEYHIRTSQGSAKSKPQIANFVFYDKNQNYISSIPDVDASEITFNSVENARFCKMSFYDSTNSQNNISPADVVGAQIQLELGSTATDYEPYFEGIKSVGDDGLTVTTANSDNTVTTSAEFTTALPLRSTLDGATRDELIIGGGKAEVITRCVVVDDSIVPLAEPIITPLTTAEISAFRSLKTYDSTTNITITDEPDFEIDYLKNSDNGQAVADIQRDLQGQIDGITVELTQAQYNALTEEEKNNGTIYFITDAPSGITIDSQLSATSTNAVQNRVITSQVNKMLSEAEIQVQINDRIYQGTDLTVKFADEISASPYNGDPWAWIKARIQAENFVGIHVGDYIPITCTNGVTLNAQIAGINTYKNYGDSPVCAHIDFICKELWPTLKPVNPVNFNNGTAAENHPWLASDLYLYLNSLAGTVPSAAEVGGGEGTAVDYTADGVYYFLPTQLKNVIIEKKFLLPTRYSASVLLSDDNSWTWKNIGKLWLPGECEIYGMPVWGGKVGYSLGGSALQYPLFAGNMNRLKFRNGRSFGWWLLSLSSGYSTHWCFTSARGDCYTTGTSASAIAAPVCFRVG